MANVTDDGLFLLYNEVFKKFLPDYMIVWAESLEYRPWLFAFFGSALVGLSGIFPLLVIPIDDNSSHTSNANSPFLKVLLSFAVGALLGDVFLHLLPEAWQYALQHSQEQGNSHVSLKCGLFVLFGLLLFIIVEKLFAEPHDEEEPVEAEEPVSAGDYGGADGEDTVKKSVVKKRNQVKTAVSTGSLEIEDMARLITAEKTKRDKVPNLKKSGAILLDDDSGDNPLFASCLLNNNTDEGVTVSCGMVLGGSGVCGGSLANGVVRGRCLKGNSWIGRTIRENIKKDKKEKSKHISGYLNLMANSIDNFTHGLAVGGSFMVSFRVGLLSTFAILIHEIPHEVGDFAILLRSGFTRWEAAKAQIATAAAGLVGAMTAVYFSGATNTLEAKTSWILPFTAGGFLHISLITVLPDLLKEESPIESLKQLSALLFGIAIMGTLTVLID